MLFILSYTIMVVFQFMLCQVKMLSAISWNPEFKDKKFNIILGIGIPELLLNLVSCHGFIKKLNSNVILNFQTCLINKYLSKGLSIIEQNTKQLSLLPNDVKSRINMIIQLDTDYFLVKRRHLRHIKHHQTITYSERYVFDLLTGLI